MEERYPTGTFRIEAFHAPSERGVRPELYAAFVRITLARPCANRCDHDLDDSDDRPALRTHVRNGLRLVGQAIEARFLAQSARVARSVQRIRSGLSRCIPRERPGRSSVRQSKPPRSKGQHRVPACPPTPATGQGPRLPATARSTGVRIRMPEKLIRMPLPDGGVGNDILKGGLGDDILTGGDGDDTLTGGTASPGADADFLLMNPGSSDDDTLDGGAGDDTLAGGAGNDTLYGGDGDDTVDGGVGNDRLEGGRGADRLTGSRGADSLHGGSGQDVFAFAVGDGADYISDFEAGDIIEIAGVPGGFGDLVIEQKGFSTVIRYGDGDTIKLEGVTAASLGADDFRFLPVETVPPEGGDEDWSAPLKLVHPKVQDEEGQPWPERVTSRIRSSACCGRWRCCTARTCRWRRRSVGSGSARSRSTGGARRMPG